jgi:hypothetical protein
LFRDGANLFVQIAVRQEAQGQDSGGRERNGNDP